MGDSGVYAYIAFACLGLVVFFLCCGPLIYWPYAYGSEMSPMARRNTFCLGVVISFFVHDFAMGWIEIWIVWRFGWSEIFQAISLFLTLFCFTIGFFTTWISYTWRMSKVLQIRFGSAAPSRSTVSASAVAKADTSQRI